MDICRTLYLTTSKDTSYWSALKTHTKIDYVLGHRVSLNNFQWFKIAYYKLYACNEIKLKITNRNITGSSIYLNTY